MNKKETKQTFIDVRSVLKLFKTYKMKFLAKNFILDV